MCESCETRNRLPSHPKWLRKMSHCWLGQQKIIKLQTLAADGVTQPLKDLEGTLAENFCSTTNTDMLLRPP
ncbi:hypothetical protein HBH56_138150 [Parastagonospora nodorum]|nr:hypothetical protein HBH56_138150 [Parastagonospora nodorum]KAH3928139.1 hypothetical protein HBH54_143290 [Parastagonospora nodorum]KAH3949155.1 hypothetical protein HBH53_093290 [Parastagonospora nodorum]KAH3983535.1 hypothetical protein HBH51_034820 [Parastagonospora nodorum]KAH4005614.1 hypothetical protein HBI10_035840 [Parastagonospora nodorum]